MRSQTDFFSSAITCFKVSVKENNPVDKGEQVYLYRYYVFKYPICSSRVCAVLIFTLSEKATAGIIDPRNSDRVVYV